MTFNPNRAVLSRGQEEFWCDRLCWDCQKAETIKGKAVSLVRV